MTKKLIKIIVLFIAILFLSYGCNNNINNNTVKVTFNANGGTLTDDETQTINCYNKISKPNDPIREGYTFEGWYVDDEKWSFIGYIVTSDIELSAKWTINQYTLTLKNYYGDNDLVITKNYGEEINVVNPELLGYTFEGWSEELPSVMPAEDKVIYAHFEQTKYILTIKYNDGVTEDQIFTKYSGDAIDIEQPKRSGYFFWKWESSNKLDNKIMPSENLTLTAIWSTIQRNISVTDANLTKMVDEGGKIYVTALGQADRDYIKEICEDALGAKAFTFNNQLTAADVNAGDLVISVVGYTSKGISGDITLAGEIARAKAFAEKEGINFVLVQLDGKSRRGESTDPIIEAAVGGADLVLIYDADDGKGANYDNKYSDVWCKDKLYCLYLFKNEYNIKDYIEAIAK